MDKQEIRWLALAVLENSMVKATDKELSEMLGISRQTIYRWRKAPEYLAYDIIYTYMQDNAKVSTPQKIEATAHNYIRTVKDKERQEQAQSAE